MRAVIADAGRPTTHPHLSSRASFILSNKLYVQVVVGILKRCEARLLEMRDMEKMVAFLRMEVPQWRHDTLQVSLSYQAT